MINDISSESQKRVKANNDSSGIDGINIEIINEYLKYIASPQSDILLGHRRSGVTEDGKL